MVDTANGTGRRHQTGRIPPPPEFTFPDSGITVGLRRFAPDTQDTIARELTRQHPPPPIPIVETELGDEPNPADPDYQQALSRYFQQQAVDVAARMVELALRRIVVEVDSEAVNQLKADMAAIGTPLPEDMDDHTIYLRHICISSTYDLTSMMAYLQRRSMPTEAVVQEFLESFRRDVPGT